MSNDLEYKVNRMADSIYAKINVSEPELALAAFLYDVAKEIPVAIEDAVSEVETFDGDLHDSQQENDRLEKENESLQDKLDEIQKIIG